VVTVAAKNRNKDIMARLLDLQRDRIPITENVVQAAAKNSNYGKDENALLRFHIHLLEVLAKRT
jgi:hypothetical protein